MLSKTEKTVLKEAYKSDKAMETLITLCDEYGGRFAGTEENKMAAEYILSLYEDYNFNNPLLEHFSFPGCKVGESSLIIKGTNRAIETLSLPMTANGTIEGEIISIETMEDVELSDLDGKIVLGSNRFPLRASVEHGAIGFIWMHPFPMMGPPTGVVPQLVPSVSIRYEDGALLKRKMDRGAVSVRLTAECDVFERESWNVCGEVTGEGDGGYVLLGGHYDGHEIAQAAFDCGAACMAITEMGRILNEIQGLKGNVKVVCFSAEEFGFYGSKDYAARHENKMKNMKFTYQLDCNGGFNPQMVTVDYWPQLVTLYDELRADLGLPVPFDQRMGPGDSRAFHELGIPTGSIIDYRELGRYALLKTVRHTIYDTVDKINPIRLQDDVVIGAVSSMRILEHDDWPVHRSRKDVLALKRRLQNLPLG
jgi:Iap family predicted aminopeptidase